MIRLAELKDINEINKIGLSFKSNFANTYNIADYLNNNNYIILVNEDEVVNGFIIVYKNIDYYELLMIVVDKSFRNRHIGNNLLSFILDNYVKNNDILLEVDASNSNAINLYKKFGFETINIRKKYYINNDAYVMKRVVK